MTDVVVIGGGIVGSSAAYHLARQGVRVTLIDRGDSGQATAAGAGIIAPGTSHKPPPAFYALSARSVAYYPRLLAQLAEDGEHDTGYAVVGSLLVATSDEEWNRLDEIEQQARDRLAAGVQGIGTVLRLTGAEARTLFPALGDVAGAIHVAGSARVDGRRLRDALQRAAGKHGASIVRGNARVICSGDRLSYVDLDGTRLTPDAVIIAGGAWSGELDIDLPVFPQRGQILHLEMPDVATGGWPIVLGFHSHYLLTFPPSRVVAGATREDDAGYDVRVTAGGVHEALGEALRLAPGLAGATVHEVRVGLRPATPDRLPILGPAPGLTNVYLATGHGPSGLQLGPYSGAAVADLALGLDSDAELAPFAPDRFDGR